jgi:xylan 1,4-beta-xylosidase
MPKGTRSEMYLLESWRYGWQRFGEHHDDTFLDPFIEGSHMTKYKGKYYLQYGAPGTEFSGYADGLIVGENPLGGFASMSDPLSLKMGGFARGAGHGATFTDHWGNFWHVSTMVISVKNNFERRLGIWPAGFDQDDNMWCNTSFGDYPTYLPQVDGEKRAGHPLNYEANLRPGWMLLNYKKPVKISSTLGSFAPNNAVDENIKTYWSAATANKGEFIQTDLGSASDVYAIQINYADQDVDSNRLGKWNGQYHQYVLYASMNGEQWTTLADKSNNTTDVPHDYVELPKPVEARFLKLENIHMPTGKFAISGLRVFGFGKGSPPASVRQFYVLRTEKDKRSAWLKWNPVTDAYAYNIYYGTDPGRLYTSIMVHDANEYWLKTLDSQKTYYFTIEAINENGVSEKLKVVKSE